MFFSVKPKETKKGFKKSEKVKANDHQEWDSQRMGAACGTFQGLKPLFWYLFESSASKGPQLEVLWYLLGY